MADRSDTGPYLFLLPSRNIGCGIDKTYARCEIRKHDWEAPPKPTDCLLDWGDNIKVMSTGPGHFRCVGDTVIGAATNILPYGSLSRRGPMECRSEESGVQCTNLDTGHGFAMSRTEYSLF